MNATTGQVDVGALEVHRGTLISQCRWILGSWSEAEDAVQETMVRAWQHLGEFAGRRSLLSWLRSIARNVCCDMLRTTQRKARPVDPASWPGGVGSDGPEPAERAVTREGVRHAFVATLLHLPPRQRCALLLCEVLQWQATEVAELLGTTVASVNSALQRARTTVAAHARGRGADRSGALDDEQRRLLHRYLQAFERHDLATLAHLEHAAT